MSNYSRAEIAKALGVSSSLNYKKLIERRMNMFNL